MHDGKPSRTALAAAAHRALHQTMDRGRIFADPLATAIVSAGQSEPPVAPDDDAGRRMRFFVAARARIAEDALADAVAAGVTQVVVLGAGLDTFAYRNARDDVRVFEVDHPATQAWKRARLASAGIAEPATLRFVACDFEREAFDEVLAAHGFARDEAAFFTWLGVVPYLREEAVLGTLARIAGVPGGATVAFDYAEPPEVLDASGRAAHDARAAYVAALGEPWRTSFTAEAMRSHLTEAGFTRFEDAGPRDLARRFAPERVAAVRDRGGRVVIASTHPGRGAFEAAVPTRASRTRSPAGGG